MRALSSDELVVVVAVEGVALGFVCCLFFLLFLLCRNRRLERKNRRMRKVRSKDEKSCLYKRSLRYPEVKLEERAARNLQSNKNEDFNKYVITFVVCALIMVSLDTWSVPFEVVVVAPLESDSLPRKRKLS